MMHIVIDFDNTIVDSSRTIHNIYKKERYIEEMFNHEHGWDFEGLLPKDYIDRAKRLFDEKVFYDNLIIFPKAKEVIECLKALGHTVLIATKHSGEGVKYKEEWIKENLGVEVYFTDTFDKGMLLGDVFIDDKLECIESVKGNFKHILCYGRYLWNKDYSGKRVLNWTEVANYIMNIERTGKLIVIDSSVDGCGKATQTELLYNRLVKEGYNVKRVSFPNYNSESSSMVKMYLRGDFGKKADDVDPYIVSTFYAMDRYSVYKTELEDFYNKGGIILADRYVSSNMIHQATKVETDKLDHYLDWLDDLEHNLYGIPRPTKVLFLDMSFESSEKLREGRANKIDNTNKQDIHESDTDYLKRSYNTAQYIADKFDWCKVNCECNGELLSREKISDIVYATVREELLKL